MKKVAFMFVAMVAMSFAACGNKDNAAEAVDSTAQDSSVVVEDSTAQDSCTVDSCAQDSVK